MRGRKVWRGEGPAGSVLLLQTSALPLPLPGLSSRSMGSVGMDGCPGPAEFTACTWNT